ncbi:MAG: DNA polymerase III subunit beta [Clostridia bacterium]|nr:DNA polymerase III subunit beta [Clostridia bacterium]
MKIVCNTELLSTACQNVQRAISGKTSIPALEGILFSAKGDKVRLTGFDLDMGIITEVDAKVEKDGEIIINAKLLCDILRRLPEEKVTIETDERMIVDIECGQSNFSIIGIKSDEYPDVPNIRMNNPIEISQNVIKNMIRQTIFSVDSTENKPIYKGICFDIKEGEIKLVSTDGYRLSIRKEKISYNENELTFVVPAKTLSEVSKLVSDKEEPVRIYIEKRHIVFETENYRIISRLLEGEFLDYEKVVRMDGKIKAKVNRRVFAESVERTSIVTNEKIRVALRCVFNENSVKISCNTSIGKAMDKFFADITGERIEIGFSNRYLLDALHNIEDDEIMLSMSGANLPMIITPMQGDSYCYLILPVRLKNE